MKKLLVLIMAALMILAMAVAGCGGDDKKADNGSTPHKEKLVIGTDADINNLNLTKTTGRCQQRYSEEHSPDSGILQ